MQASGLSASAYPAGQHDSAFANASNSNPLDLVVRAGQPYDIVLRLSDGKSVTMTGQKVDEGGTLTLEATSQGFR